MYRIGLSGGIASGKSTVIDMLKQLGAQVIDCDILAREVVEPGTPGLVAVCKAFGSEACQADGTLNRRYIGDIVFNAPERKKELEAILHPLIFKRIDEMVAMYAEEQGAKVVFLDMPLLFELKYFMYVDEAWLVYVDPQTQLKRLMARNNFTEDEASARIRAQLPIDEKRSLAQVIIDNAESLENTEKQVREAWDKLADRIHLQEG
jgi:dephospho-CoA kinase